MAKAIFRLKAKVYTLPSGNQIVVYMNNEKINRATIADVDIVVEKYINELLSNQAHVMFDNLTPYLPSKERIVSLEFRVLQVVANLTTNQEYADKTSVLKEFGKNDYRQVEEIIDDLILKNVFEVRAGSSSYKIKVGMFRRWLNVKHNYTKPDLIINPFIAGNPVLGGDFYGRKAEITKILQSINVMSFLLDAQWRTGKTSFLFKIREELLNSPHGYYLSTYLSLNDCKEENIWYELAQSLIKECKDRHSYHPHELPTLPTDNDRSDFVKRDLTDIFNKLISLAEIRPNEKTRKKIRFVLLIDEAQTINKYSDFTKADLRNFLSQDPRTKNHLSCILAGYQINKLASTHGSPWTNFMTLTTLSPLHEHDFSILVTQPIIERYGDRYQVHSSALNKIKKYSESIPYDAQAFCHNAFSEMIHRGESVISEDIVESIKPAAMREIHAATSGLRGEN